MRRFSLLLLVTVALNAQAAGCRAVSGALTRPLVELYTSEGCDSCPPADRWLAATFPPEQAHAGVALAFHVDYWDRLGWKDRFALPRYTERQYSTMRANGAGFVYTPQVIVQGREVRSWQGRGATDAVAAARQRQARAAIAIEATPGAALEVRATASVPEASRRKEAALWLAYVDSGHVTDVAAGENRGVRLRHDHVVRSLQGPFPFDSGGSALASLTIATPRDAGRSPALIAFVQDARDGDVLQTLPLPACW